MLQLLLKLGIGNSCKHFFHFLSTDYPRMMSTEQIYEADKKGKQLQLKSTEILLRRRKKGSDLFNYLYLNCIDCVSNNVKHDCVYKQFFVGKKRLPISELLFKLQQIESIFDVYEFIEQGPNKVIPVVGNKHRHEILK